MGVELLSGLDLLFGLRGSRVCVGLLSGLDLYGCTSGCCLRSICYLGFVGVGPTSERCLGSIFVCVCSTWVVVFGSGLGVLVGGSIGCVGRWVETVLTVRSYGRVGPGVRTLSPRS